MSNDISSVELSLDNTQLSAAGVASEKVITLVWLIKKELLLQCWKNNNRTAEIITSLL